MTADDLERALDDLWDSHLMDDIPEKWQPALKRIIDRAAALGDAAGFERGRAVGREEHRQASWNVIESLVQSLLPRLTDEELAEFKRRAQEAVVIANAHRKAKEGDGG